MARPKNYELWLALLAALLVGTIYLVILYWTGFDIPPAGGFFGHAMGIAGFLLMLMTEILYSLRKRSRMAHWGRMSGWLSFHIFTGLLGPFLVLLHSSWKFNGLAGWTTLLTAIIVISGFIGRYIYTAIPRSADGSALELEQIEQQLAQFDSQASQMETAGISRKKEVQRLLKQRNLLQHQAASLARTRHLLALWHSFHVPVGITLFTLAFMHIIAGMYYATFLH